jgi:DNA topoisomerase-1
MLRETVELSSAPSPEVAKVAGLRYVSDARPGITRRRAGKAFTYRNAEGRTVRDPETLRRIRTLAIPPAWTEVWVCPLENGHIQATGRDARGRKQYRYHPDWRTVRDEAKPRS